MDFITITRDTVKRILDMETCIKLVKNAHAKLAKGQAVQPLRTALIDQSMKGILATMPAYIGGENEILGLKTVTVFHENHKYGLESHQGTITLLNPNTGRIIAIVDGEEITAMRTAAASAVATNYLAKKDAKHLALIGAGVQAHTHLKSISLIRELESVRIWNRTHSKAEEFVKSYQSEFNISTSESIDVVLEGADIICTLTASKVPLIHLNQVNPGTHINAVGSSTPNGRELDTELITNSEIYTDVIESALNEAGEIIIPLKNGDIKAAPNLVELGDLITGKHSGRKHDEITIYKSLGVGIQDIVNANYVYNKVKAA